LPEKYFSPELGEQLSPLPSYAYGWRRGSSQITLGFFLSLLTITGLELVGGLLSVDGEGE